MANDTCVCPIHLMQALGMLRGYLLGSGASQEMHDALDGVAGVIEDVCAPPPDEPTETVN